MVVTRHGEARVSTGSVVGALSQPLDVGAVLLRGETPLLRPTARRRCASRRRRRPDRLGDQGGEPGARGIPVAQLSAVLGCRDREYTVDQATTQPLQESLALNR